LCEDDEYVLVDGKTLAPEVAAYVLGVDDDSLSGNLERGRKLIAQPERRLVGAAHVEAVPLHPHRADMWFQVPMDRAGDIEGVLKHL
jgi:hypothetical protein